MHTLFVTPRLPSVNDTSTARQWYLLRLLREIGSDVDLLWLAWPGDGPCDGHAVESLGVRVHRISAKPGRFVRVGGKLVPQAQPAMAAAAAEWIEKTDLVVCADAPCHMYVRDLLWPMARPPFCMIDLGEPESARLLTQARSASVFRGWRLRAQADAMRDAEASAAFQADVVLVSNLVDMEILAERAADANLWLIGDGVDVPPSREPSGRMACDGVMLAADLSQVSDARAAGWLTQVVMPIVRQTRKQAVLHVLAPHLPRALRRAVRQGVVQWHHGELTPASMRELAEACSVCVAPQRQARGAAEWVLQAMVMNRPVVCTHTVASTLPMDVGSAPLVADRANDLAAGIVRMLTNPREAAQRGATGRRLVEANATWPVQWARVGALLAELAMKQSPRITSDLKRARGAAAQAAAGI